MVTLTQEKYHKIVCVGCSSGSLVHANSQSRGGLVIVIILYQLGIRMRTIEECLAGKLVDFGRFMYVCELSLVEVCCRE